MKVKNNNKDYDTIENDFTQGVEHFNRRIASKAFHNDNFFAYMCLLIKRKPVLFNDMGALMGVSLTKRGTINLHYAADIIKYIPDSLLMKIIEHECLHIIRKHLIRFNNWIENEVTVNDYQKEDKFKVFNKATDCAINPQIKNFNKVIELLCPFLHDDEKVYKLCFPEVYDLENNNASEYYYKEIKKQMKGDKCSECGKSHNDIDDADSYKDFEKDIDDNFEDYMEKYLEKVKELKSDNILYLRGNILPTGWNRFSKLNRFNIDKDNYTLVAYVEKGNYSFRVGSEDWGNSIGLNKKGDLVNNKNSKSMDLRSEGATYKFNLKLPKEKNPELYVEKLPYKKELYLVNHEDKYDRSRFRYIEENIFILSISVTDKFMEKNLKYRIGDIDFNNNSFSFKNIIEIGKEVTLVNDKKNPFSLNISKKGNYKLTLKTIDIKKPTLTIEKVDDNKCDKDSESGDKNNGCSKCGSGAGSHKGWLVPGLYKGSVLRKADRYTKGLVRKVATTMKNRGTIPSELQLLIDECLREPTLPYYQIIRRFFKASRKSKFKRSAKKMNKKRLYCFYLPKDLPQILPYPGKIRDRTFNIVILIDTSGSMDNEDLLEALSSSKNLLENDRHIKVTIIECDAKIENEYEIKKISDIKPKFKGGGGTTLFPGLERAKQLNPDTVLAFTDGYCENINDIDRKLLPPRIMWVVPEDRGDVKTLEGYGYIVRY